MAKLQDPSMIQITTKKKSFKLSIPARTFKYLMANRTLNSLYLQYLEDMFPSIKTIHNLVAKIAVAHTKRSIKFETRIFEELY